MAKAAKEETVKIESSEITILPAEVEKKVNAEIGLIRVEANVTDEVIKKLTEEYGGLTIKDQSDKEGYLSVQEARKHVKKIRVAAGKLFDKGREEAVAVADKWLVNKKNVIDALKAIEDPLEKQEDEYEAEDKCIKAEKAQKLEQQRIERTDDMIRFGARIEANGWVLGDLAYETILVAHCDPEIYAGIKAEYKAIFDANEKVKADEAEKTRLANEKLLKDQEDLKRMQKEAKDMRTQGRISFLESLGMAKNHTRQGHTYADQYVSMVDIEEKEAQDWEVIIAGVREGVEAAKELAAQAEKNREIFANRFPRLTGWSTNGQSVYSKGTTWGSTADIIDMSDEDFEKLVADNDQYLKEQEDEKQKKRDKELEDARIEGVGRSRREMLKSINADAGVSDLELGNIPAEQWEQDLKTATHLFNKKKKEEDDKKEKDRVALLGEKSLYEELVAKLKVIQVPVLKSGQYAGKANAIRTFINNL